MAVVKWSIVHLGNFNVIILLSMTLLIQWLDKRAFNNYGSIIAFSHNCHINMLYLHQEKSVYIYFRKKKRNSFIFMYILNRYEFILHIKRWIFFMLYMTILCTDIVILEFKQYSVESRWRKVSIFRKDHMETGDQAVGFYGGIRKLCKKEEIEKWRHLWPDCTLE